MQPTNLLAAVIVSNAAFWYTEAAVLFATCVWLGWKYRAFWKDFYHFTINYTGLFVILVLLYLIVYGQIGTSFGIQNLFWDSGPFGRFAASLSATLLLGLIGTLACHLDPNPRRSALKISAFLNAHRSVLSWRTHSPQNSGAAQPPAAEQTMSQSPDEPPAPVPAAPRTARRPPERGPD